MRGGFFHRSDQSTFGQIRRQEMATSYQCGFEMARILAERQFRYSMIVVLFPCFFTGPDAAGMGRRNESSAMKIRRIRYLVARLLRASLNTLFSPVRFMREGPAKNRVRSFLLRFQHALPVRLAVNAGDVAVQVGTPNPGTLRELSSAVGATGRVIILEASSANAGTLVDAAARLKDDNVTIVHCAAWFESGELELAVSPFHGDHRVMLDGVEHDNDFRSGDAYPQTEQVKARRVDDVLAELGQDAADYIAITVNGAELEVLRGCERLLKRPSMRLYIKGHALVDGEPLCVPIRAYLDERGLSSLLTRGEPGVGSDSRWRRRSGDVFAWLPG